MFKGRNSLYYLRCIVLQGKECSDDGALYPAQYGMRSDLLCRSPGNEYEWNFSQSHVQNLHNYLQCLCGGMWAASHGSLPGMRRILPQLRGRMQEACDLIDFLSTTDDRRRTTDHSVYKQYIKNFKSSTFEAPWSVVRG